MNSKLILCVLCCAAVLTTAPLAFGRGGGGHFGGGGGAHFSGMSARSGHSYGRGGMRSGGRYWSGGSSRNWSGRNWSGRNWSGRHWNGRNWCNNVIFIGDFGFPYWWGGGYPYGYYGYGYPYDYYGDGYGYGYGGGYGYDYGQSGYGNGNGTRSRVAELQRRLARAGYYSGSIDGVLGPQTRRAIRAYERDHGNVG